MDVWIPWGIPLWVLFENPLEPHLVEFWGKGSMIYNLVKIYWYVGFGSYLISLLLFLIDCLEVVFSRHTNPPTGVKSMSILSPVNPEHIASEKLNESILPRLEFKKLEEKSEHITEKLYSTIHSHHSGFEIHMSSFSTKTSVTIWCRYNYSSNRLRVIVMFPRPTENISPPIFSFGGN